MSQSRTHKDGTAPASRKPPLPKPSKATKPVSAQGPRSGKAAVAQSGDQGGGRAKRQEEGGSIQAAARPNASSPFISATLQLIPGECRVPAASGCGRGRAWEADGPMVLEQNPLTHSRNHSPHSEGPEVLPPASVTACRPNYQERMPAHRSSASPRGLTRRAMSETRGHASSFLLFRPHGQ